MTQIDLQQANECFSALAELVAKGEEILIVKDNQPFIKLVPVTPARKRRHFGSAQGLIQMTDDFTQPLEEFRDYMVCISWKSVRG